MKPGLFNDLPDDMKALIGEVLAVNLINAGSITGIWARVVTFQLVKGVVAIAHFNQDQTAAVLNVPVAVMPVYGKNLSWSDVLQLTTLIPEIPSAQYALKDKAVFFTLFLPLDPFEPEKIHDVFGILNKGIDEVRTDLLDAIHDFYDIQPPDEVSYPKPVLPDIKMTPKEMENIHGVLKRCSGPVQEIYKFIMKKWFKAGYIVGAASWAIELELPYGNRTIPLAMLAYGVSESLAILNPLSIARPPSIYLLWEALRKLQAFPAESIDSYERAVKKITNLRTTKPYAQIDVDEQFDMQTARALLKAIISLAKSIQPEKVEAPGTSGPVTPKNIELTLAACPEHVRQIYRLLVQDWKAAGGKVECYKPGRICLKFTTKAHKNGIIAQISRTFNLLVLAAPRGKRIAKMEVAWDLYTDEYAAYLDCIPGDVGRFEQFVTELPGFERKGTVTHVWVDEKFLLEHAVLLSRAMLELKQAEQAMP